MTEASALAIYLLLSPRTNDECNAMIEDVIKVYVHTRCSCRIVGFVSITVSIIVIPQSFPAVAK